MTNIINSIYNILDNIFKLKQNNIVSDENLKNCFKILVLDENAANFLNPLIKQNDLEQNKIVLTLNINQIREKLEDIMAIYICLPTKQNFDIILKDLENNIYENYSFNFIENVNENEFNDFLSNILKFNVDKIFNLNVFPINLQIFHKNVFDINYNQPFYFLNIKSNEEKITNYFNLISNKLLNLCFILKINPIIKYQKKNNYFTQIISKFHNKFNSIFQKFPELKQNFNFKSKNLLLILNREIDINIMIHHGSSYASMINEVCKIETQNSNNSKTIFQVDPINDYIWEKSINSSFIDVGEETYLEYKKYFNENNIEIKANNNDNLDEIEKKSEMLTEQIKNIDKKKLKGDLLAKHANFYNIIKKNVDEKNLGQIYEIEYLILNNKNINDEINKKISEFKYNLNKENYLDILRLFLIYYFYYVEDNETFYNNFIKQFETFIEKKKLKNLLNFIENKKNENGIISNSNNEEKNNIAKKYIKKGFNFFIDTVKNLYTSKDPSITSQLIENIIKNKNVDEIETEIFFKNLNLYTEDQYYENVIIFMIGGGSYSEYEYICNKLERYNINIIYGSDKIYKPNEFLLELNDISNNNNNI